MFSCSMFDPAFTQGNEEVDPIEDPIEDPVIDPVPDPIAEGTLPIGMNLPELNYYSRALIFNDAMTTASDMLTYHGSSWDTDRLDELDLDENGYPTSLPQTTSNGEDTMVRFLISNYYDGRYRIFFDGEGSLSGSDVRSDSDGYYIDFDGTGGHCWIEITSSTAGNYLHNIQILPEGYTPEDLENGTLGTFYAPYLEGLEDFHALRFMDWSQTNYSKQVHWEDRITKDYYTQGGDFGTSFDYAIELCNELQKDAWICVPHKASDDYITQLAELFKADLDPNLTIYLEYSNELWNWMFSQANWVLENASGAVDSYVSSDLSDIDSGDSMHPEKDAYMMARLFTLWDDVFGSEMDNRVVRVATGQHAWVDNTRRILEYLHDDSAAFGAVGCDVMSVGGYFDFTDENHEDWLEKGSDLTFEEIYSDAYDSFLERAYVWTNKTAAYCNEYGVDYMVYEGGQHMQPHDQEGHWNYNDVLYDFQISDQMYDLYMHNFDLHMEDDVDCQLFMAYSYIGPRESQYGSWGHLETMDQIGGSYGDAPKFKALLDVNW